MLCLNLLPSLLLLECLSSILGNPTQDCPQYWKDVQWMKGRKGMYGTARIKTVKDCHSWCIDYAERTDMYRCEGWSFWGNQGSPWTLGDSWCYLFNNKDSITDYGVPLEETGVEAQGAISGLKYDCKSEPMRNCTASEFTCAHSGHCIPAEFKCDGEPICGDGSDEFPSLCGECTESEFACVDGNECIRAEWICDGYPECTDRSDEFPSLCGECTESEFACVDEKQCIKAERKCDGYAQCTDKSDEFPSLCGGCTESEFACVDGKQCIRAEWKCDGFAQCTDKSDEEKCG